MDRIWAPWRLAYVQGEAEGGVSSARALAFPPGADPECFLCQAAVDAAHDRRRLVVARNRHCVTVLNRYPYNNGHVLVAPCCHRAGLEALAAEEHAAIAQEMTRLVGVLERLLKADGINIGLNLGRAAGAGLPGHLHWHIVPRWVGDTNFMPALAGIKVIPQSLETLWEALVLGEGAR
jgi:ATP adenylyltransferase